MSAAIQQALLAQRAAWQAVVGMAVGVADDPTTSVAALFILVNSLAALLGNPSSVSNLTPMLAVLLPVAIAGGWIGAEYGSRRLATPLLRRLLAPVLVVAGTKLIFT